MDTVQGNSLIWNWKQYFLKSTLELGQSDAQNGKILNFSSDPNGRWAKGVTENGFHVEIKSIPADMHEFKAYPKWTQLHGGQYASGKYLFSNYYSCDCSQGIKGIRCRHLASLLYYWEEEHGPFVLLEDEEKKRERLRREEEKRLERLRREEEERRRKEKQEQVFDAADYFAASKLPEPKGLFFSPDKILKASNILTNRYEAEAADGLLLRGAVLPTDIVCRFGRDGQQCLYIIGNADGRTVRISLQKDRITSLNCTCNQSWLANGSYWCRTSQMCCHALAVWSRARNRIIEENPGDDTDEAGDKLLSLLAGNPAEEPTAEPAGQTARRKKANLILSPRITGEKGGGSLKLSFDLGQAGGRMYAVKGLESLVRHVEAEEDFSLSKTLTVHFAEEAFTEDSAKWYQMILSRVNAIRRVNDRLNSGFYSYRELSAGTGIPLEDGDLDSVYDLAQGGEILYQYGGRNEAVPVRVEETHPKAEVRLEPVKTGGRVTAIRMTGKMPRLLQGNQAQYVLDEHCFGRVSNEELKALEPFRAIEKGAGVFSCTIGERKLAEFYYRVLPGIRETEQIILTDCVGGAVDALLPPEPEFVFYLDIDGAITCRATVRYGENTLPLGFAASGGSAGHLDPDQEKRAVTALTQFFPSQDQERQCFFVPLDDDALMRVLTDGVAVLSRLGEVKGSDAISRLHVRPAPQPQVSVRVDGGLLDLSIQTKDISEEELLSLLESYRRKKRWHRLKNGDFVDLRNPERLEELDDTVREMDLTLEELLRGGVKVPKYRALYVDQLLEDHNELAASRDRQFKALIRSFQTIRDSDFEVSEALSDVMRPYQAYGFRWLSTLNQSGFGGILADEMGLGKTLQMLSLIQAQRDDGETKPALVICPASLVYNWKEEARKFTPGLTVETLAGNLWQRKKAFQDMEGKEGAALYITSYDLIKRDITLYHDLRFSTVVLDEAQYIKNQKAAVSKAVRVLKADHRFALTGTPIENRLSELWSIFDFLMPGFLYTASEFANRFETPIMKRKDAEMTARLSKMTEPFILRRKKTDVLKDLPEKLEETRSAAMEEDQRRLYDAQVVHMRELLDSTGDSGEDKMRILAEITRLRQLCCDPSLLFEDYQGTSAKRAACLELIQSAMDAGHRMLVFSQFTSMLKLLSDDLRREGIPFFTLTGSTPKQERVELVRSFNTGDTPVFLISLKAGGTGLNLTGADVVIHYDPWWNVAVQNQATDRAHRIGQTRQVTVIKLIAAETIEEKIVALQEAKRDLAEAIMSGQSNSLMSLTREELLELLS